MVYDPRIRAGIFAGESGGDYDALFGFQNRPGGKYANIKVSQMPIDEVIRFTMPGGEYGQATKKQIGRVATPTGAYQVVGTTLRAMKKKMGLTGKEIYNREMQDRIGQEILETQGTGAWAGYKGPRNPKAAISKGPATVKPFTGQASISKQPVSSGKPALAKAGIADIGKETVPEWTPTVVDTAEPMTEGTRLSTALADSLEAMTPKQDEAAWDWVFKAMQPRVIQAPAFNIWEQRRGTV